MKLWINYDKDHDVWTIFHKEVTIRDTRDVDEWRRQLNAEFSKLEGKKKLCCSYGTNLAKTITQKL